MDTLERLMVKITKAQFDALPEWPGYGPFNAWHQWNTSDGKPHAVRLILDFTDGLRPCVDVHPVEFANEESV